MTKKQSNMNKLGRAVKSFNPITYKMTDPRARKMKPSNPFGAKAKKARGAYYDIKPQKRTKKKK